MKKLLFLIPVLFLVACSGPAKTAADDSEAVTAAVSDYLTNSKGIELKNVELTVSDIKKENEAIKCLATIALKENKEAKFQYRYTLKKKDGKWAVAASEGFGMPHSSKPAPPEGLPAGHPPVDAPKGDDGKAVPAVPEGHPPAAK